MPADNEIRLAELLCARLCHDLAGPIGGAAAGAELMADEDGADPETAELVAASVAVASRHLRFLRAALGGGTQPFAAGEMEALARGLLGDSGPHTLDWQADTAGWSRDMGRLALNMVMIARDSLPRGGAISLRAEAGRPHVGAAGPQIAADEMLAALAATSPDSLGPRGAPAYLAARLATRLNGRLRAVPTFDGLDLSLCDGG